MNENILFFLFFFFNDTATTEIYTLSLHDALPIYRWEFLPAPLASSRLFELAPVEFRGLRLTDLDVPAAHNLSEQSSRLAQRRLHVEAGEAGDAIFGDYDVEPPHGGARGGVVNADVGNRAADDKGIDIPQA